MKFLFFLGLNMFFFKNSFADICNRPEEIRKVLEELLKKSCRKIELKDISTVDSLKINFLTTTKIKEGDLEGLINLRILRISGNCESIEKFAFKNMKLDTLEMSHTLKVIKSLAFQNSEINYLDMMFSDKLESIQPHAFENAKIKTLNFWGSDKAIAAIDPLAFDGLQTEHLDLGNERNDKYQVLTGKFQGARIGTLSLTYSNINVLETDTFQDAQISKINLENNKIEKIMPLAFSNLNLVELNLKLNKLSLFEDKAFDLLSAKFINLYENPISESEKERLLYTYPNLDFAF